MFNHTPTTILFYATGVIYFYGIIQQWAGQLCALSLHGIVLLWVNRDTIGIATVARYLVVTILFLIVEPTCYFLMNVNDHIMKRWLVYCYKR